MSVSRRISLVVCQAFLVSVCVLGAVGVAPALAGPTVYVRVLDETSTLLPRTAVTLNQPEPVSGCAADSVAAAINLAVNGNWDHGEAFPGGDFTETILGHTEAFANESATWSEWVNYRWGGGICTDLLGEGEEVLMIANHEPPPTYGPTVLPLVVTAAPTAVEAGVPFTVTVSAGTFSETSNGAEPLPAEGVTVAGAGASAITGSNGIATLTIANAGQATLEATKAGDAPAIPVGICVYSGADNTCVKQSTLKTGGGGSSTVGGTSNNGSSPQALAASLLGLVEGHAYAPRQAPRLLQGSVSAGGILGKVKLRLTRRWRTRAGHVHCSFYSGVTDTFKGMRCGASHGHFFSVGSQSSFSYLLPSALAPGRYVLDLEAINGAGEHTTLARGSTRLVFYVR